MTLVNPPYNDTYHFEIEGFYEATGYPPIPNEDSFFPIMNTSATVSGTTVYLSSSNSKVTVLFLTDN